MSPIDPILVLTPSDSNNAAFRNRTRLLELWQQRAPLRLRNNHRIVMGITRGESMKGTYGHHSVRINGLEHIIDLDYPWTAINEGDTIVFIYWNKEGQNALRQELYVHEVYKVEFEGLLTRGTSYRHSDGAIVTDFGDYSLTDKLYPEPPELGNFYKQRIRSLYIGKSILPIDNNNCEIKRYISEKELPAEDDAP